jgi:trigger factor
MQVSVENVSELGRRMTVTVEDVNIEQSVQTRLKAIRPTVKMAGFRPGKVPMSMVARSHGPAARREVIDQLVQESMQEAFVQEGINPASPPNIDEMDEKDGNLVYSMSYEVFPDVGSVEVKDLTLEKTVAEVTDEDVDGMLETLREQRSTLEPLKRGAKEGDTLTIDFVGTIDGETFQGGTGSDMNFEIGAGRMLPDFEAPLLGKKAGQEVEVVMTFPEDYQAENLQGKEAKFDVTVKQVAKKKLPKLDKEFAALCGVEAGVAALKKEVRANMERELSNALKTNNKKRAMDMLVENNEITIPEAPVQREAEFLVEQAKSNLAQQGVNVEGLPFDPENFKPNAERRVKLSLLMGKIISDNSIQPDEDRVKAAIDVIAASYEDPQEVVDYYMNDQQRLSQIQMTVVEDMVVEWIYDNVKVEESTSTFQEVVNSAQN